MRRKRAGRPVGHARVWLPRLALAAIAVASVAASPVASSIAATRPSGPPAAGARGTISARDRAATRAYLEAEITYLRALINGAPGAEEAVRAVASRLGAECPGVLAGAPREALATQTREEAQTARQRGESNRESRQRSTLQEELSLALSPAAQRSGQMAALGFAHKLERLLWTNAALTQLEHATALVLERESKLPAPDPCADMRAWASSGYRTLSAASKAQAAAREATLQPLLRLLASSPGVVGAGSILAYEDRPLKALARTAERLTYRQLGSSRWQAGIAAAVKLKLGFPPGEAEGTESPPKGAVLIAHGETAAGGHYRIWVEPQSAGSSADPHTERCSVTVGLEEQRAVPDGGIPGAASASTAGACLSRRHPQAATVQCNEGLLSVEAQVAARVRRVRLELGDGRRVTSAVALVPARLGGPLGFYHQVVSGSSAPVAITELTAGGRALRTVRLPRTGRCVAARPVAPRLAVRTVARGRIPGGPRFTIVGHRQLSGGPDFGLSLEVAGAPLLQSAESGGASSGFGGALSGNGTRGRPAVLRLEMSTGCSPHQYAILYGILQAPADTVLANTPAGPARFRRAPLPRGLHQQGVLVYVVLAAPPSSVVVREPGGRTVFRDGNITPTAHEALETCEGEAEGPP